MIDQPRETLCELIATYGRALCDDPRRCEALLRDLCGTHRREIHVLVSALRERVAADLLAASEGVPREVLWARLTQRLQDNLGLTEDLARWAVDSWALALGKFSPAEPSVAAASSALSAPVAAVGVAPTRRRQLMLAGLGAGFGLLTILAIVLFKLPQPSPQGDRGRADAPSVGLAAKIPEQISEEIGCTIKNHCETLIVRKVDLNEDGVKEIIVDSSENGFFGGTGGFQTWIFQQTQSGYRGIGDFFGFLHITKILSTKTNGYFDIEFRYKHYFEKGGWEWERETRIVKWDGMEYSVWVNPEFGAKDNQKVSSP